VSIRAQLALLFAVVCATTVAVSTLVALWEIDRTERIAHEELEAIGVEGVNVAIIAGGIVGGGVGLMLGFVLVRRLRRPLGDLRDGAAAVASGRFDHRVPVRGPVEVRQLATAFNGMAAAMPLPPVVVAMPVPSRRNQVSSVNWARSRELASPKLT